LLPLFDRRRATGMYDAVKTTRQTVFSRIRLYCLAAAPADILRRATMPPPPHTNRRHTHHTFSTIAFRAPADV